MKFLQTLESAYILKTVGHYNETSVFLYTIVPHILC